MSISPLLQQALEESVSRAFGALVKESGSANVVQNAVDAVYSIFRDVQVALLRKWNMEHVDYLSFLPVETRTSIFGWLDFKSLVRVTHVCCSWREVALNDPRLWNYFDSQTMPYKALQEMIDRSRPANFHFRQTGTGYISHLGREQIMPIVLNMERMESIHVQGNGFYERFAMNNIWAPALRSLSFDCTTPVTLPRPEVVPVLHTLRLCFLLQPTLPEPLASVKVLTYSLRDDSIDLRCLETLLPNLEDLTLQFEHSKPSIKYPTSPLRRLLRYSLTLSSTNITVSSRQARINIAMPLPASNWQEGIPPKLIEYFEPFCGKQGWELLGDTVLPRRQYPVHRLALTARNGACEIQARKFGMMLILPSPRVYITSLIIEDDLLSTVLDDALSTLTSLAIIITSPDLLWPDLTIPRIHVPNLKVFSLRARESIGHIMDLFNDRPARNVVKVVSFDDQRLDRIEFVSSVPYTFERTKWADLMEFAQELRVVNLDSKRVYDSLH